MFVVFIRFVIYSRLLVPYQINSNCSGILARTKMYQEGRRTVLEYYLRIYLQGLRKTIENVVQNRRYQEGTRTEYLPNARLIRSTSVL
jgi:hypothetical protein